MRRVSLQGNKFTGLDHQPDGTVADVIIVNAAAVSLVLQRQLRSER